MANDIKRTVTVELRTASDGTLRAQLGGTTKEIDAATKATGALDKATDALGKTSGTAAKATAEAAEATAKVGVASVDTTRTVEALTNVVKRATSGMQGATPSTADVVDTVRDLGTIAGSTTGLLSSMAIAGTAVTTMLAALGVAAIYGAREQELYNDALELTGHAAGVTTAELGQMAAAMDDMDGVTQHYAAGVLDAVTATGRFSDTAIPMVARAAVQMEQATGRAINSTIALFERLGADPATAIAKLNESEHFLTVGTYAQIAALQAQGREHEAAAVAQRAYADAVDARTKDIAQNVGWLEKAWSGLKGTVTETWDAMLGVGREQGLGAQAAAIQKQIDALQKPHLDRAGNLVQASQPEEMARLQAALADIRKQQVAAGFAAVNQSADAQAAADAIAARQSWDKRLAAAKDGAAKAAEIAKINTEAAALLAGGVDAKIVEAQKKTLIAAVDKKYAVRDPVATAQLNAEVQGYKAALANLDNAFSSSNEILASARRAGLIDEGQYYAQRTALIDQHEQQVVTAVNADIKALQQRKATGAQAVRLAQQIAELEARSAKESADAATARTRASNEHVQAIKKEQAAIDQYTASLNDMLATRANAIDIRVGAVGMGDVQADLYGRINDVHRDSDRKLVDLNRERTAGHLSATQYAADLEALQRYEDERVRMEIEADERIRAARADPVNGVMRALANIRDQGQDMAGGMESAITSAFGNMTDAAAAWATGTDVSIGDVAKSFEAALIRMELQALAAQAATALLGWLGGGYGGTGGMGGVSYNTQGFVSGVYAEGGHVRGPGTETSDSIIARLSNNEYVLRGAAVRKYGVHHLDAMNSLSAPGFAGGGLVGGTSSGALGGAPITVNIYGTENGARVEQSQDTDGSRLIEVFLGAAVKDVVTGGRLGQAVNAVTGTRRPGRSYAGA